MKPNPLLTVVSAVCFCSTLACDKQSSNAAVASASAGSSNASAASAAEINDRPRLYRAISGPYFLDGARFDPIRTDAFTAFCGGLRKVADSKDPFVSKLASTARVEQRTHSVMYDNAFAVRSGGDLDVAGLVKTKLTDDLIGFAQAFANSGFLARQVLYDAMNMETDAQAQDERMAAYAEILTDANSHPRGPAVDPKLFSPDFVDRQPGSLHLTMRNGTGHSLHNALVIAVVKHDADKRYTAGDDDNTLVNALVNAGPKLQNAEAAVKAARVHSMNADGGFTVFVPEWRDGQTLESALIDVYEIAELSHADVSVFADEASVAAIPLPLDKMADATKKPAEALPAEKTFDAQQFLDVWEQAKSLRVTKGDGVITYRYLVYPFWSQGVTKIVAPPDMKYLNITWDSSVDVSMSVDGQIINSEPFAQAVVDGHMINDAAKIGCTPGKTLAFKTLSTNDPVPIAIRFLQREPTAEEKDHVELMAPAAASH